MKSYIHETVRRLLELRSLEERLASLRGDTAEKSQAETAVESIRASLPDGVRLVHDQMRAQGKRSIAAVRGLVCSGCHLALGVGNVAAIRRGELRRCGHCGRHVYLVEEEEEATPAPAPARKTRTRSAATKRASLLRR